MPFTFSHPAAVLPIRRYGVLSALVVGSLMPDMLYFVPQLPHNSYGHTLQGIFFFCLPVGVCLLWLFHRFLKRPLVSLFPVVQQQKLLAVSKDFQFWPFSRFVAICFSILLGAASHVTWDSFTHQQGWAVQQFAILRRPVPITPLVAPTVCELLQYVSSVIGAVLLLIYYRRWLRQTQARAATGEVHLTTSMRILLLLVFGFGATLPAISRMMNNPFWYGRQSFVGYVATAGIKVLCIEIILFSLLWHLVRRLRRNSSSERVPE